VLRATAADAVVVVGVLLAGGIRAPTIEVLAAEAEATGTPIGCILVTKLPAPAALLLIALFSNTT
jgi:hypothetical protein